MATIDQLNEGVKSFIRDLEALGAEKIRVDEWQLGSRLRFRFSYAHKEQRIHVSNADRELMVVSINLDLKPTSMPHAIDVIEKAGQIGDLGIQRVQHVDWRLMS